MYGGGEIGGGQSEAPRVSWSRGASVASGATVRECRRRLRGASGRLLGGGAHLRRAATTRAQLFGAQRAAIHEDLLGVLEPQPTSAERAAHLPDRVGVLRTDHPDRGRDELACA